MDWAEPEVGLTLGEGAFGVVSVCKRRATGEEFAVKMVDKVETTVEAIKKEAEMLEAMARQPREQLKCFSRRCFVCIVMDKLDGGDLVEGLQRHLKERGQINCHDVVHVACPGSWVMAGAHFTLLGWTSLVVDVYFCFM
ncbi:unnamed protein product [Durusdinium trenchii]|uniref:Protein kinase domain-containing protein n=1 Tax=Durusdinium trenchii TaxID=1381693 RepID=A0ABP0RZ12_9DINO